MGGYCTTSVTELPDASQTVEGTELPEWVSAGGKMLFEQAANIASSPYPEYTGPRIATYGGSKLTPDEQRAADILREGADSYKPYIDLAGASAMTLGKGYDSMTRDELLGEPYEGATRQELLGDPFSIETAQPFLDIYQSATDPAVRQIDQTLYDNLALARAKAAKGGGGFGSRLGILEGQTTGEAAKQAGDLRAQAAKEGLSFAADRYDTDREARFGAEDVMRGRFTEDRTARFGAEDVMRGRFTEDRTARFGAEDAARAAYEAEEASRLRRTQQLEGMAPLVQGLQEQAAAGLISTGQAQRQLDQMALDLAYADYTDQRQYPQQQLNFLLGALQGVPYDQTSYGMKTGSQYIQNPSIYGQTLGGLGALYNAYNLSRA